MKFSGIATDDQGKRGVFSAEFTASRVAQHIGARGGPSNQLSNFAQANDTIGPLDTTRLFYSTSLPPVMGTVEAGLPPDVLPVVSYKKQDVNVMGYVASVTRPLWLCYHHEPEGDYATGSTFVGEFRQQAALIRSAGNPLVSVVMISGGYQWETGGAGADGSFLVEPYDTDLYAQDVYQHQRGTGRNAWPAHGLADYGRFQNWMAAVAPRGLPLALTEYGIDADGVTADQANATRGLRIHDDAAYLRTAVPDLALWSYWWVPSPSSPPDPTNDYRFTDTDTVATWKDIASGTL